MAEAATVQPVEETREHLRGLPLRDRLERDLPAPHDPLCLAEPPDEVRIFGDSISGCIRLPEHVGAHRALRVHRGSVPTYEIVVWPKPGPNRDGCRHPNHADLTSCRHRHAHG